MSAQHIFFGELAKAMFARPLNVSAAENCSFLRQGAVDVAQRWFGALGVHY
jgi:hypothetical protein